MTLLSDEEKKLIHAIRYGDESSREEFIEFCHPIIRKNIRRFFRAEEVEDIEANVFIEVIKGIKKHEIKESLSGWIKTLTENYCKNKIRHDRLRQSIRGINPVIDIESYPDSKGIAPGSKEYHESIKNKGEQKTLTKEMIVFNYKKAVPFATQEGIEISLEYIKLLYDWKKNSEKILPNISQFLKLSMFSVIQKGKLIKSQGQYRHRKFQNIQFFH